MNGSVVLDASALLAFLKSEPGAEQVEPHLGVSVISSVNWLEVVEKMMLLGVDHEALREALPQVEIAAFLEPHAAVAARMREPTRHLGVSLVDRACLSLAALRDASVLTSDRALAQVDVGVELRLIR